MRYIRYLFLAALAVILVTVALANRGDVTLTLLPEGLAGLAGFNYAVTLPVFIVIVGGIIAGLAIGFAWEWLREHKHRAVAAKSTAEVKKLEREVKRLKADSGEEDDPVIALLDKAG